MSDRHKRCEHGKRRYRCRECGGVNLCQHRRQRHQCKECGGVSICEHGRQRCRCWHCHPIGAAKSAKTAAARRNYSWELSGERAVWLSTQACAYCGVLGGNGLDRVKNEWGYTTMNTVPCCSKCNYMKHTMTAQEFIDHRNKIVSTYEQFKAGWIETRTSGPGLGVNDGTV